MGQTPSSSSNAKVRLHLETATKTGALVLSNRKLTEVPDLSVVAGSLRTLDISSNRLTVMPAALTDITTLKHLQLSDNKISSLPESIERLTKLESLSVQRNVLTSIPQGLAQLKHLKSIVLSGNSLTEFPVSVCSLPHLDLLDLSHNNIKEIPDHIASLHALELNLNQNQICIISPSISECPRLKSLRLEENCLLLDAIPEQLLTDSQVSLLCVTGNLFSNKQLEDTDGYSKYMERYTATKKKMF